MKVLFIILIVLAILAALLIFYRQSNIKKNKIRMSEMFFRRIAPLYNKFNKEEEVTMADVLPYAKASTTREIVYRLLQHYNRTELFPPEYLSIRLAAESNLVNWLEYPTELNAPPDAISHIKTVTVPFNGVQQLAHYEVFKFKKEEPHWAAKKGWIIGVVGPYFTESHPYDYPQATFSRLNSNIENSSADKEALWVHHNISLKSVLKST